MTTIASNVNALSGLALLALVGWVVSASLALAGHAAAPPVLAAAMQDCGPAGKSAIVTVPCIFALAAYCGVLIYCAGEENTF